jgi:RNA polymerase sigma factor (sigma-70 family)
VNENQWLARFEANRTHLRAVAYRILGSVGEADDAVQETWIRLSRSDADNIENLGGWLTTVVGRVSLNMLHSRRIRREEPLDAVHVPDPVVDPLDRTDPEHEALLADSVGLALLVVLESLSPAERLAFVLHDMFGVPFSEIARIVERSPAAARQLASRARRRVRVEETIPDDLETQRKVIEAFLEAARGGDFDRLIAVLAPDAVLRADMGLADGSGEVRGAEAIARQAMTFARRGLAIELARINGAVGVVTRQDGEPFSVTAFTVRSRRIVAMDILGDPERLRRLDLSLIE